MPAVICPKPPGKSRMLAPRRIAQAVNPSADRSDIPPRVTLATNAPPFAGELREEQSKLLTAPLPNGATAILCTLRRPWNFVGFLVDPGSATAVGNINALLFVLSRNVAGLLLTSPLVAGLGPQAFATIIVGARVELRVHNLTGGPVTGLRGALWGMSER